MEEFLTKAQYRKEIQKLLKENKKTVSITDILKELNINRGNYYCFMGRSGGKGEDKTMSIANLDEILKRIKSKDKRNTNKTRLMCLSNEECAKKIYELFVENPLREYLDIKKWLSSTNEELIYEGEDAYLICKQNNKIPCKKISEENRFGEKYAQIIIPTEQQVQIVPIKNVEVIE